MKQKIVIAAPLVVVLMLSFLAPRAAGDTIEEEVDRFELFSDCNPMSFLVERLPPDSSKIGLAHEALQAAVESRLRSAHLYHSERSTPYLYVNVNVIGDAFNVALRYNKLVHDRLSGISNAAGTWWTSVTGTHGGDAGYILSSVSQRMDRFLVEFLRVNEAACEKRFALPSSEKTKPFWENE